MRLVLASLVLLAAPALAAYRNEIKVRREPRMSALLRCCVAYSERQRESPTDD
jgi:hypothetical protein